MLVKTCEFGMMYTSALNVAVPAQPEPHVQSYRMEIPGSKKLSTIELFSYFLSFLFIFMDLQSYHI